MELQHRRWVGRFARLGLVAFAIIFVATFFLRKIPHKIRDVKIQAEVPSELAVAAGDLRIVSIDSSVDLVLQGNKVLAGLSPYMIQKVRSEIERSTAKDTTGLGGSIAQMVKGTVSNAIGMHVAYDVADISDIRYEDGTIKIELKSGRNADLFDQAKVNGRKVSRSFHEADAQRFIEMVHARQRSTPTTR